MPRVPLLGRISFRDYAALILGFLFLAFEACLHIIIILFLPKPVINWFYRQSRSLFHRIAKQPKHRSEEKRAADNVLNARDFGELCTLYGYTHEEHVVLTKDGYLLGLHRLPSKKGQRRNNPGGSTGKPVVYLHHGLLMNSEVWVCLTDASRALPFVLAEQGYDVWLGNNR
jgi:lysosomal acid lipase/cholesteryl ester hydrolase